MFQGVEEIYYAVGAQGLKMGKRIPKYPVYIPSKGRSDRPLTAKMFDRDGVPFRFVVEPNEVPAYAADWGEERVLVLPENNRGLVYSRNWIKQHAIGEGHERHWQFDDDVWRLRRLHHGRRYPCDSRIALVVAEDFVDRYENVGLCSFNSSFFVPATQGISLQKWPPFYLNSRCYTNFLMMNSLPYGWRNRYNEDTDMTLQVLAGGWCTILFNVFVMDTPETMEAHGGQMMSATGSYQGDGRLKMARELERVWPHVVETRRRFKRPQHHIKHDWKKFDTPLVRKAGVEDAPPDEYGMALVPQKREKDDGGKRGRVG